MLDAVTDIYVIVLYYKTEGLRGQAVAMLAMIATNMVFQIVCVLGQYRYVVSPIVLDRLDAAR